MSARSTIKKSAIGVAGLAVAAFAAAAYDFGFNEQAEIEKIAVIELTPKGGTRLTTADGNVYQSWVGSGPPAGMFFSGGDFEITYTGGYAASLFGAPRNPVMIQRASPQP